MKYDNQLRYAVNIIRDYDGRYPLAAWLKDFFRENKQMGSRDRKTVAELVYGYFRLGHNTYDSVEERLLAGLFAADHLPDLKAYFNTRNTGYSSEKIFGWTDLLSEGIEPGPFAASFLTQPDVFIRLRPGKREQVLSKLASSGLSYTICNEACISLPNSTKIDAVLRINKEAVIQDKSSQQTGCLVKDLQIQNAWDCCAASGGKSIMLHDLKPDVELTASDIRESIIHNLKVRFGEAGIPRYTSFVADLTAANAKLPDRQYDLVIADVPCTGSGTWSRTPEQLLFFKPSDIGRYTTLQKKITSTAAETLRRGGYFLYITCSVFRSENEELVEYLVAEKKLRLVDQRVIRGYDSRADTMFAALLTNEPV